MKKETEQLFNELYDKPANVFKVLKVMKREGKDVGGKCLRGKDGRLSFSEVDRGKIWKDHMEKIMNVENEWDHRMEVDIVQGPIEKITREEIVKTIRAMKLGKAAGPSEVSTEMIIASGEIEVDVMMELFQNVLDRKGIPEEWKTSVAVPIFKGKGDVMSCGSYRGAKLLEHAMKIVERVLERRIRLVVNLDEMQCGFMPGKGKNRCTVCCKKNARRI